MSKLCDKDFADHLPAAYEQDTIAYYCHSIQKKAKENKS